MIEGMEIFMLTQKILLQQEKTAANAYLYTYFLDNSRELDDGLLRPMVIICPGGAYRLTSDREGELLALKFLAMGCHAAVLRYSVAPAKYPTALCELALAVKYVRENAKTYFVDENKIIVQGSSAGGHLAASLGVFWNDGMLADLLGAESRWFQPNAQILSYPVITSGEFAHQESFEMLLGEQKEELKEKMSLETQVNPDTPPTFIWHTYMDQSVPVENALLFVQALRRAGIPAEFHMFSVGRHGLGTAGRLTAGRDGIALQKECECWLSMAEAWIWNL